MKTKKPRAKQTPKMSGLVVAALRNLRDAHGSSPREIMKYIMAEYNASEATVHRQLKTALKQGVEYGILKRSSGGYALNTDADVIGPFDLAQVDACGSCKPKRRGCRPKKRKASCRPKRRKRAACPRKRKRNPCNVCATRGRKSDCNQPVQLVRDDSPANVDEDEATASNEADKRSVDEAKARSRSVSRRGSARQGRSRSRSETGFTDDEDDKDEE